MGGGREALAHHYAVGMRTRTSRLVAGAGPVAAAIAIALAAAASAGAGAREGAAARAAERASAGDCTRPRTYDVVTVDPRHHVSRQTFIALLVRSERLWEAPFGRDLLRYQPGGTIRVRLIYDERQLKFDEVVAAKAAVERGKAANAAEKAALKPASAEIARRRASYDKRIAYWNERGGAPKDVFAELQQQRDELNELVRVFNERTATYNRDVAEFNRQVVAYNALIRSRTGTDKELGKAELGGKAVEIAVLAGTAKDDVLIAHEFGHILGIGHIAGAGNIMNPLLARILTRASSADLAGLRRACAAAGR